LLIVLCLDDRNDRVSDDYRRIHNSISGFSQLELDLATLFNRGGAEAAERAQGIIEALAILCAAVRFLLIAIVITTSEWENPLGKRRYPDEK
jgi:hypothetical protein